MSKYTLFMMLLVFSSVYPLMILLDLIPREYALYAIFPYGCGVFAISYQLSKTIYEACVSHMPFRYHLHETWGLYIAAIAVFVIYYRYFDQCSSSECRDYLGVFWALVVSIPIWVNMFFLALECGAHNHFRHIHLLMLSFLTIGGCSFLLMVFSLLYSIL